MGLSKRADKTDDTKGDVAVIGTIIDTCEDGSVGDIWGGVAARACPRDSRTCLERDRSSMNASGINALCPRQALATSCSTGHRKVARW